MTEQTVYIYALIDPRNDEVRYIGKTNDPKRRLRYHIAVSRRRDHLYVHRWIRAVLQCDLRPILTVIEEADSSAWEEAERRYIRHFREQGCRLTNATDGGEGGPNTFGEDHPVATHTEAEIRELWRLYLAGERPADVAKRLGMKTPYVCAIIRGDSWRHLHPGPSAIRKANCGRRGEDNRNTRLDRSQVLTVLEMYGRGMITSAIADRMGVSTSLVRQVRSGRQWSGISPEIDQARTQAHIDRRQFLEDQERKQERDVIELRRQGLDVATIAKRVRIDVGRVLTIIRQQGLVLDLKKGKLPANTRLTKAEADAIWKRHAAGESQASLARSFGVSEYPIYQIVHNKHYTSHDRRLE